MQIKTTMRYHLKSVRMAVIKKTKNNKCCKNFDKSEHVYTAGGNVNWYSVENSIEFPPKSKKTKLPYDPAVPLLGIYPEEIKSESQRDNCTPRFIAALFTVGETWKQHKYLSSDDCLKKM